VIGAAVHKELVGTVLGRASFVKLYDEADCLRNLDGLAQREVILWIGVGSLEDLFSAEVDALAGQCLKAIEQVRL
jgi:hypothetical protein